MPFLPADGAWGLAPTNQASCVMLSQAAEAQQRPPGDGAPSGELTRTIPGVTSLQGFLAQSLA